MYRHRDAHGDVSRLVAADGRGDDHSGVCYVYVLAALGPSLVQNNRYFIVSELCTMPLSLMMQVRIRNMNRTEQDIMHAGSEQLQRKWETKPQAPALLTSSACVCVCRRGRLRDVARVPLGRWACSRRLVIHRLRAARGYVSHVAADGRGDDPSRVICVLALVDSWVQNKPLLCGFITF
jgi:hypothetical protein